MECPLRTRTGALAALGGWLSKGRSPLFWRAMLAGVLLCWWLFLAVILLSGRGWHPFWWAYAEDIASVADFPWHVAAVLSVALAVALLVPLAPSAGRIGPPGGWRTWLAAVALVLLVPQLWVGGIWLWGPTLAPAETTLAGRPTRPVLWIIAESADAGLHLPKVDARRHDYYSVSYSRSVPSGPFAGVWAQICGDQLDATGSGARHRCLVDEDWRIVHGHSQSARINALLASTGADVIGGEAFAGSAASRPGGVLDAELLLMAASFTPEHDGAGANAVTSVTTTPAMRHVLVLTGNTLGDVRANDAAMDAAIGEWLDRGGIALVTANRPRRQEGWNALPARLYGVPRLNLPPTSDVALQLGKAGPGRLMGGWRPGTLYDVGCTAWELAGFGCRRVGHGVSLSRERSVTRKLFRSQR